jgi:glycosidase
MLYEFHILAEVRREYQFDETLYGFNGNVVFANFHAVRLFAKKMNDRRDLAKYPERAVRAGQLNAMGLIDEICHYMIRRYEEAMNPGVFGRVVRSVRDELGESDVQSALATLCRIFPPRDVYRKIATGEEYLSRSTGAKPHVEVSFEEMIMIWFANINPAFAPFHELFNDGTLRATTPYPKMIESAQAFFQSEKPFGEGGPTLFELLREPMLASPHSLEGQLAFIRKHWGVHLSKMYLDKLAGAGDLIREETKATFAGGTAESVVPTYDRDRYQRDPDHEQFTADLDWMPNVVILAKNSYVWLDQLSKKYQRAIRKLNEIPDEELDQLANWNFSGLWLIGVWERSEASKVMKQMMGNPEAVASAYSVYEYAIAADLGGEDAFQDLRRRAWHRGIRLAGDMVPNHVGLHSKWVVEHPEYFIQTSYSPFPNYQFTGHNFSTTPGLEIRIEDGYWTRRDAAVVFQRVESHGAAVRYIYHGNDGTSFPWNDTAQLDFIRADVREAVIREIFHVAEKFSIIRFDAAMVLAKKHFQRLWYPEPGSGGDIPSRADHAMTKEAFDRAFPVEFWREVVDRINRDKPSTLLLAEAFWLLEGYFVRTLGMHRVYNSAFMHMMMKEENAKYRELIYNTLAFNPEILKRYVNFMSNPDEKTAVEQFGKEDKYFGIAMVMVTIPGLPMFAHGQIEGFTEKYGMEYQRAYYEESPDPLLVARHEREIFPLLKMRHLFSQVAQFELYNFYGADGNINENVFVYSNAYGGERALVCYNNRYESSPGGIGRSLPKVNTQGQESAGKSAGEALGLKRERGYFYDLRDHRTGLHYLRSGEELSDGLQLILGGYEYHLFLGFEELRDAAGEYAALAAHLGGRGTPGIGEALRAFRLLPIHQAFAFFLDEGAADGITTYFFEPEPTQSALRKSIDETGKRFIGVLGKIQSFIGRSADVAGETASLSANVQNARRILQQSAKEKFPLELPANVDRRKFSCTLLALIAAMRLGEFVKRFNLESGDAFEFLKMDAMIDGALARVMPDVRTRGSLVSLVLCVMKHEAAMRDAARTRLVSGFGVVLNDAVVRSYLDVHVHEGIEYFRKESFDELIEWLSLAAMIRGNEQDDQVIQISQIPPVPTVSTVPTHPLTSSGEMTIFRNMKEVVTRLRNLSSTSEYKFATLMARLQKSAPQSQSVVHE